jgi:RNA polymerase sigma factor (sigma-70 family)
MTDIQVEFERLWERGAQREALALVVAAWREPLRRLAIRKGARESNAEDIVQAALLRFYLSYGAKRYSVIKAVLYTTVARLAWNERRAERRHPRVGIEHDAAQMRCAGSNYEPESILTWAEDLARLRAALNLLPEAHREIVRLRYLEEQALEVGEIAESMGRSKRWVEKAITASRQELRGRLGRDRGERDHGNASREPCGGCTRAA